MRAPPSRLALVASTIAVLCLAGCATTLSSVNEENPYPPSWPRIESRTTDLGCPILHGSFNNHSFQDSAQLGNNIGSLAEIIQNATTAGRRIWPKSEVIALPREILAVSFVQSHDALDLKFHEPSGSYAAVQLRRFRWSSELEFERVQKFYCEQMSEGPVLRLMATVDRIAGASIFGAGGREVIIWFYSAIDGSLIVRLQSQSVDVTTFLVGSNVTNSSLWLRFQPVDLSVVRVP